MDKYPIKTIEQCKDEISHKYGHGGFSVVLFKVSDGSAPTHEANKIINEAIELYASQFQTPITSELPNDDDIKKTAETDTFIYEIFNEDESKLYVQAYINGASEMREIASAVIARKEKQNRKLAIEFANWREDIRCSNYKEPEKKIYFNCSGQGSQLQVRLKSDNELYELYQSKKNKQEQP